MKHSIGKTIAKLRKERKWTQLELAEKLGVSDKAVSKWESEGGFPEITQFPILSKLFDVTIDYLMTGKTADTITLDDMDEQKRMEYLIRRDDAENYTKYGYLSKTSVFDISPDNAPLKAILTHKSKNIFQACAEKQFAIALSFISNPSFSMR